MRDPTKMTYSISDFVNRIAVDRAEKSRIKSRHKVVTQWIHVLDIK